MKPKQRFSRGRRSRFVCLKCRKVFAKTTRFTCSPFTIHEARSVSLRSLSRPLGERRIFDAEVQVAQSLFRCPHCKSKLINMGYKFKAPKCSDKRGWQLVNDYLKIHRPKLETLNPEEILRRHKRGERIEDWERYDSNEAYKFEWRHGWPDYEN
jgi:hypothetical protein